MPIFTAQYREACILSPDKDAPSTNTVPPEGEIGSLIQCNEFWVYGMFALLIVLAGLSLKHGVFAVLGMITAFVNAFIMYVWKMLPILVDPHLNGGGWVRMLTDQGILMQNISIVVAVLYLVLNVVCMVGAFMRRKNAPHK